LLQALSWLPRTEGSIRLGFRHRDGQTMLDTLYQAGAARVRFPKVAAGQPTQAVLLNTAGGFTGGDRLDVDVRLAARTRALVTTAAAEKIYRAREGETTVRVKLAAGEGAALTWLPQATILFDRARFERRTDVDLAPDSSFLAVESFVFGRAAMGEQMHTGYCRDVWRVRRDGRLIFADTFLADGPVARMLERPATLGGARSVAMIIYIAPDAAQRIKVVRGVLESAGSTAGASAWNGMLVARALAPDGRTLAAGIKRVAERLSGHPMPRVWQC
jgi:urease accessory protein